MTLWHRELTPDLRRTLVTREVGGNYYRVPYSMPVIELSPSRAVEWDGRPFLLIGRIYGSDVSTGPETYIRWFEALQRWIRAHFVKNPVEGRYGFVGKAALEWFRQGGMLCSLPGLPTFSAVPPQWQPFIDSQDKVRASLTPAASRDPIRRPAP
jgi:hypothetical protein